MNKVIRTTLSVLISMAVLSALMAAKSTDQNSAKADKDKQQHHSRLSKAAFWRHHKNSAEKEKAASPAHAQAKAAQPRTAQVKSTSAKQATAKKEQATKKENTASKKAQKKQQAENVNKPAKKQAASAKSKPEKKTVKPATVSLKQ